MAFIVSQGVSAPPPDDDIDFWPKDWVAGKDPQLAKAVAHWGSPILLQSLMPTPIEPPSESDIFARVIATDVAISPTVARTVLAWKFPKRDVTRVRKLQEKNNAGTIMDRERRELESYVRVGRFVAVMQAMARLTLRSRRCKA